MRHLARNFLLSIVLLLCASAASAADYYVDITNRTGYTILQVFVSPAKTSQWEEDVLGSDILANNSSTRVTLTGYSSPVFDIKLVDTDGDSYTFWNVDVSRRDITATANDLD